jgi:hypothetical protein
MVRRLALRVVLMYNIITIVYLYLFVFGGVYIGIH